MPHPGSRRMMRLSMVLAGGDHLLDCLTRHPQLPGQISLGEALREQGIDQLTPLPGQLARRPGVLDRRCADLLQFVEEFGVSRRFDVLSHPPSMTTPSCHVNPRLSSEPAVYAERA